VLPGQELLQANILEFILPIRNSILVSVVKDFMILLTMSLPLHILNNELEKTV
jgi:hypothetical protein